LTTVYSPYALAVNTGTPVREARITSRPDFRCAPFVIAGDGQRTAKRPYTSYGASMRTMRLPRTAGPAVRVSIVGLALASVAELLLARRHGPAFVVAVVIAAVAVGWAAVLSWVRPKPAAASGNPAEPTEAGDHVLSPRSSEPDLSLAGRRQAVARGLAETVDANLAALVVEAVAVQQALVRDAHPEDVLVRMQAVEESARTASADLRRLLAVAALLDPDHAEDPAPSPAG
jgi:hypothetical protein